MEEEKRTLSISFQVTDACNLRCSYCYQINKKHNFMSKEIVDQILKRILPLDKTFFKNYFSNTKPFEIIYLDFIGGEPFLNVGIMEYICDSVFNYINKKKVKPKIIIQLNSNGTLIKTEKVINFCNKYNDYINYGITLDGCKEAHDMCRKDINGNGSFDKVVEAYKFIKETFHREAYTRLTLSPQNLPYFFKSFKFLVEDMGMRVVNGTHQHEDVWATSDAELYVDELIKISNYMIEHPDKEYTPLKNDIDNVEFPSCGVIGENAQIAFDVFGNVYNCTRYTDCTSPAAKLDIGNVFDKTIKQGRLKLLRSFCRTEYIEDECNNCFANTVCDNCPSFNYEHSGDGKKQAKTDCDMNKALYCVAQAYQDEINSQQSYEQDQFVLENGLKPFVNEILSQS